MNRKNTILIAVLINAGLLAVLLVIALSTQEEVVSPSSLLGEGPSHLSKFEERPLFGEGAELLLSRAPSTSNNPNDVPISLPLLGDRPVESAPPLQTVGSQESLIHKLPPLLPEEPPASLAPVREEPKSHLPLIEVTVKKGDSLEKIAKLHRTSVDEIIKTNHLPSTFLKIGQVLKIPVEKNLASSPSLPVQKGEKKGTETGPEYYTVKVGDNPWTIAMKHHMKVEELLKINALNEERARKIKPGDRLRIR